MSRYFFSETVYYSYSNSEIMSKSQRKRKELLDQVVNRLAATDDVSPSTEIIISPDGTNLLIDICHDYSTHVTPSLSSAAEDFPSSPVTPSKPPSSKHEKTDKSGEDIISTLSALINNRADGVEKLINNNTMKLEGLKKTVDFVCSEVQDLNKKMSDAEKCIDEEKQFVRLLETTRTSVIIRCDFCEEDRERRKKLWPAVKSARDAGKKAYYVRAPAFVEGKEIVLPP